MTDIVIKLPEPTAPGFLRFLRRMAVCRVVLMAPGMASPEDIDKAIDMLVELVKQPEDRDAARAAVENLSAIDLGNLLGSLKAEPDPKA